MLNLRNYIMLGLLAVFFLWYGTTWAYQTLYKEPRQRLGQKIAQLKQEIENGKKMIANGQQFIGNQQLLYYRSLPRVPNEARSQYSFWLLELLKFCDFEGAEAPSDNPTRVPLGFNRFGTNFRFHVRGVCTLDQLSRFLFEFYYAPFLHRITSMNITPQEKSEKVVVAITIDAWTIPPAYPQNPYPLANQLPTGHYRRLHSDKLDTYNVIAQRNLLQAAKGGVDKADFTFLTAVNRIGDETEAWLSVRTDGTVIKAKVGEQVRVGSFHATVKEILDEDVVFDRDGMLWLVTLGESINQAFALPKEVAAPVASP